MAAAYRLTRSEEVAHLQLQRVLPVEDVWLCKKAKMVIFDVPVKGPAQGRLYRVDSRVILSLIRRNNKGESRENSTLAKGRRSSAVYRRAVQ